MSARELSSDEIDALVDEALELLDTEEPEQALELGRRLEALNYSRSFEIQGLALQNMDKNLEAIGVLRRGIECVPDDWRLRQLYGNCLSDDEQYDEALNAYDAALGLPDADRVWVQYNRSILFWRMEDLDKANATLVKVLGDAEFSAAVPELQANIRAARLGLLNELGRAEEAVEFFETLPDLDEWSAPLAEVARLDAKYAIALWNDARIDDAHKALARAIRQDKTNSDAQWLKRKMLARDLPGGTCSFDLRIRGPWRADAFPGTDPAGGFHTEYRVVAENPAHALNFVREFEPPQIRHALEIEEVVENGRCDDPKGVYWTSAYHFYPEE
ncbi:MAG: hypothetical protein OEU46_14205 [Alphaproteobacteria bacterium]|nr:hypothetical protein [Alphaproteobacteria bacterium]